MSKLANTINELSVTACQRLAEAPGSRIGAVVPHLAGQPLAELQEAGVVGENGGLTVWGSTVAEKLQADNLDALFG